MGRRKPGTYKAETARLPCFGEISLNPTTTFSRFVDTRAFE
jgi:hypothetical protein